MAKKGSQLKRFKESLSSITRPSQGKRKRNVAANKDVDRNEKLKHIEEQFNSFDTKFTRTKHEVFGRKVKGKVGKPLVTRTIGEENRKLALVKERQRRKREGGVIDRRFGENDDDMDPEEKMLERFAREKQKRSRNSSLFNLEEDAQLTHFGQSLAEVDDFDQSEMIGLSDDDGDIKEDVVRQDHFGGDFEADSDNENINPHPERQKTKSEVMSELISKSKMYKHERQQQQDEDLEEIEALDADLGELQGLLRSVKPIRQERPARTQEMMTYDAALREMVYDKRSKPTERTKTEEEIAQEEMEQLQKLEEERSKRMRGEEVDKEEGGNVNRPRREGDDLDDDFVPDEQEADFYGLGKGALTEEANISAEEEDDEDEAQAEGEDEDEDEDEDEEEDEGGSEDGSEDGFDLARYFTDEENEVNNPDEQVDDDETTPATKRLRVAESSSSKELAYTYLCPSIFEEMLDILKDVPASSIPIVIERIEILHSTKLLMENREKLETFTPIVLKLILHLVSEDPASFSIIGGIVVRLHKLASQFPAALTQEIFAAIEAGRKRLTLSLGGHRVFPAAQDLALFYTIGQIYPTSDLFHGIVNPTTLFMGQILGQLKVTSVQDLGRGLFYQSIAKRICPEVINFINFTLLELTPVKFEGLPDTRPEKGSGARRLRSSDVPKEVPNKVSFSALYSKKIDESALKLQALNMTIELVDTAIDIWKSVPAFPEFFQSTNSILSSISRTKLYHALPSQTQTRITAVLETLSRRIKLAVGSRAALTLQNHRPIPIPSYLPRYKMAYSLDSKNDPDHERSKMSKLRAEHRREKKSVIRELRKEARTEAVVQSEEGKRRDQAYDEKMKVATGIMKGGNQVGKWERDQKRKRR